MPRRVSPRTSVKSARLALQLLEDRCTPTLDAFMIKDINPIGESNIQFITEMNGIAYFSANDNIHGQELWRSDGTAAGTYMSKDIGEGAFVGSDPSYLTPIGETLYFSTSTGSFWAGLWKTDGTTEGTVLVKELDPEGGPLGHFI